MVSSIQERYRVRSRDMPRIHRHNPVQEYDPVAAPRVIKYPWHVWFSQVPRHFILRRGRDYTIRSHAMEQQVRNMASQPHWRLKVSCSIAQDEKSVIVRVLGRLGG